MEAQKETPRYSFVYNSLVDGKDDFVGLVAYSIYKQEKIGYIRRYEERYKKTPEPTDLQDFHSQAHNRIKQYKELAAINVAKFYDGVSNELREELETEYKKKYYKKLASHWFSGVCQSILGSVLYTLLVGVVVVLFLYSRYGIVWVVKSAIDNQPVIEFPKK